MGINLLQDSGLAIERQVFNWKDIVQKPISKMNDDAFTRVRIILMNGIEMEALRFSHSFARSNKEMRLPLAQIRRIEKHQQATINWLLSSDHSPIETTIAYEQVAIEVTAHVAQNEPDPYLAQVYRFGLLEDFDHMYRFSALLDRIEGKDAGNILQFYTDVLPGRPTSQEHRHPDDDIRHNYDRNKAAAITKMHALTITAAEQQTENYYMNIGPTFSDPVARQLYAEISAIEEQHVTQYESLLDPNETWLEKWLMHEANEVYNYYCCVVQETNPRIKAIWERFLDYELGHLSYVRELFKNVERRDPAEILPSTLPEPIQYKEHRAFVRQVLNREVDLRARGKDFVPKDQESEATLRYRHSLNINGSPSDAVAGGYTWQPGTELNVEKEAA